MSNEPLQIHNVPFSVTTQIDRAPHWTMIRELTMNAIEAASRAQKDGLVQWTSREFDGIRKAVIWNAGPGMDAAELKAATDLSCEVNKSLGLDDNFGVGAKVSSLANNKEGLRYRSCKKGQVSEVLLGYDADLKQYVRFNRNLGNGRHDTVIDVTADAVKEGRTVAFDWTEVVLLGNAEDQDTVTRPFQNQDTDKNYVATTLYRRFYRLPEGVTLKLEEAFHRLQGVRTFVPIGHRSDKFARVESVPVPEHKLTIHYLHDPSVGDKSGLRKSSSGALGSTSTTCGIVHKNELYSVMTGHEWSAAAPRFGIAFGSKELCVHIELDDAEARPTQYRERLITRTSGEDILPTDYAVIVQANMPDWVKDVIKNASPRRNEDFSDLRKELQDLLNKYRVKVTGRKLDLANGTPSSEDKGEELGARNGTGIGGGGGGGGGGNGQRRRFRDAPEGATATALYEIYERAPEITILDKLEDVIEKGLKGRAAEFIVETGCLFVNGLYDAVDRTVSDVEPDFGANSDQEAVRILVTEAARRALAFRVGKATVYALAKRANEDWNGVSMQAALSKESLSIAADNYEESLAAVRKHVRDGLKVLRSAA